MVDALSVMEYCDELVPRQVPWAPLPSLLTFLATTGRKGTHPDAALARIVHLEPGESPTDVNVHLRGPLPRPIAVGESITLSVNRYEKFRGFQLKTAPTERPLPEEPAQGELLLRTRQTYTTHHGPYEFNFYERVPFAEVNETVGAVHHGLVAIGPLVNVSPRFVWHRELRDGRLASFHGDGVTMKTYCNLRVNPSSVRVVFDFEALEGYALYGETEEVKPGTELAAWRNISAGFAALGFGKPNKLFRHLSHRIVPIALARA